MCTKEAESKATKHEGRNCGSERQFACEPIRFPQKLAVVGTCTRSDPSEMDFAGTHFGRIQTETPVPVTEVATEQGIHIRTGARLPKDVYVYTHHCHSEV